MRKILENREVKNAGWIIGERIVQMGLSFIVSILSARYLGPENYGSLNYTASFITFFSAIATLGMDGVVIQKMIAEPEREGNFLGGCIVLQLVSTSLCSIAVVAVVAFLNPGDKEKLVLISIQSIQLFFQIANIFDSWFQRHLKSKYVSIAKVLASIIVTIYKIWLLATSKNITWFAFSNSLTSIVIAIVLMISYKKSKALPLKYDVAAGFYILKYSYHYIISGLMIALNGMIDKIMIGQMISDTYVGLYSIGTAICNMWVFVPLAIINSFRPTILALHQAGKLELYNKRLRQLYSFIIWLCVGASTIICVAAPLLISILYGEAYMGAVNTLRIMIWFETFSMIGTARGIWILAEDKNKYVKYFLAISALANIILNSFFIPIWGVEGAALATLITQIVASLIAPLFFKETRIHTKIVLESFFLLWYFKSKNSDNSKSM